MEIRGTVNFLDKCSAKTNIKVVKTETTVAKIGMGQATHILTT